MRQRYAAEATKTTTRAMTTTWDRPVFVLNCLTYLADTLAPHACAARKRAELDGAVEARVLELIEDHVRWISLPYLMQNSTFDVSRHGVFRSTRRSCTTRAYTTPSAHASKHHQTYVSLLSFAHVIQLIEPPFLPSPFFTYAIPTSGTPRARTRMYAPRAPQFTLFICALARLSRRSACSTTRCAHGTCPACARTPRGAAAPRACIRGIVYARARPPVAI